ncbi:alpha-D-ribose 1-methylphosphonate 5-triphosphate diphosphatase [Gracilibacillus sp. YIM 98692]|uniref:alpha-D-ribose 1-methylphosphonate 5-triphosphate diphosphatase n=1 Tax=Gracilibacillus sp. YIM 98692 TaxID=2663532 RepID=UPI0013D15D4D|nr:alpha-D-ribose 1-methylphosphonate 5-triphosphate diphosphatase [Gracilibacillus sp. YIM 98692]
MHLKRTIYNANIVTPTEVIKQGSIVIEGNSITKIYRGNPTNVQSVDINASGKWVIPGLIDSHSDAIEMELEPRPNSNVPMEISFYELEKKLVGEGITTIYHSLSLLEDNANKWIRRTDTALQMIRDIKRLSIGQHLIRHKTHLRYEITNLSAFEEVKQMIRDHQIDQLSFMDHTPGQGQFRDLEVHKHFLMAHRHHTEEAAEQLIQESKKQKKLDPEALQKLANLAHDYHIPIASHDDDTVEKLSLVKDWNAQISEFPIELEVAKKAKEMGLFVVMGAPNALLGKSHSNNLSALEAVKHNAVDMFCSDYYPSSLLHTTFKLYHQGMPLHQAVNMVSLNPAKALNISDQLGSIEIGKDADILLISEDGKRPVIETVMVKGKVICEMNYQLPVKEEELSTSNV